MNAHAARLVVGAVLALAGVCLLAGPTPARAAGGGPLRSLGCTPMRTDPALEAPLYAQQEGAGGAPDGWWCQLPHATMVPSGFREIRRSVAPLADLYSEYTTEYGPGAARSVDGGSDTGPEILVTDDVNSSVTPPAHLRYPPATEGRKVSLGHGVTATVSRQGGTTTVTWRYPVSGVPKYLRAVAQVTVSGSHESPSIVMEVARHVRPD